MPRSARVPFGDSVRSRAALPGRREGCRSSSATGPRAPGRLAHGRARTAPAPRGRYRVRVKPDGSGYWRAELADGPVLEQPPSGERGRDRASTPAPAPSGSRSARGRARGSAGRNGMVGDRVVVRGKVSPAGAERRVVVRIGGESAAHRGARRGGHFALAWKAPHTGVFRRRGEGALEPHRHRQPRLGRAGDRLPAGRCVLVRPGPVRQRARLRRHALAVDDGRREPVAALRHQGPPALRATAR